MSILIKGMDMPTSCADCPIWSRCYELFAAQERFIKERPEWCPLVEVPTPHGWLIDAEALAGEYAEYVKRSNISDFAPTPNWNDAISLFWSAPTVIESEE